MLGRVLHGEGLDDEGLTRWLEQETQVYSALKRNPWSLDDNAAALPSNAAFNQHYFVRHLPPGNFRCCLALGAASGSDYAMLRGRVDRFVAIEPVRGFWRETLAGAPAEFREPTLRGVIALPDESCDLAGCFGVLHHVANVSEVLVELARLLTPGGHLMIREPILSMGDFRKPRPGLTPNERGIPHQLMDRMLDRAGFDVARKNFVDFSRLDLVASRLGLRQPWQSPAFIRLDAVVSRLSAWNMRYWRPRLWHKFAPTTACWIAVKRHRP